MSNDPSNFTLSRGSVFVGEREIRHCKAFLDDGAFRFSTSEITPENLEMMSEAIAKSGVLTDVKWVAANPKGRNVDLLFSNVRLRFSGSLLGDDGWQELDFIADFSSTAFQYSVRPETPQAEARDVIAAETSSP